jgi:hypothetical protein
MSDSPDLSAEHSEATTDRETIRRGGEPAAVEGTGDDGAGVLRLQFPDTREDHDDLEPIGWNEFFEKFDEEDLAFVYQGEIEDGDTSRFYKFVDRATV